MQQILYIIGLILSIGGLGLMIRFGFRMSTRIEFSGTIPAGDRAGAEVMRRHNNDLKGRLGFVMVVLGLVLQASSSWCVWMTG